VIKETEQLNRNLDERQQRDGYSCNAMKFGRNLHMFRKNYYFHLQGRKRRNNAMLPVQFLFGLTFKPGD
jgi:hypothetical protein